MQSDIGGCTVGLFLTQRRNSHAIATRSAYFALKGFTSWRIQARTHKTRPRAGPGGVHVCTAIILPSCSFQVYNHPSSTLVSAPAGDTPTKPSASAVCRMSAGSGATNVISLPSSTGCVTVSCFACSACLGGCGSVGGVSPVVAAFCPRNDAGRYIMSPSMGKPTCARCTRICAHQRRPRRQQFDLSENGWRQPSRRQLMIYV